MKKKSVDQLKQAGFVVAPFALVLMVRLFNGEGVAPAAASASTPGPEPAGEVVDAPLAIALATKPNAKQMAAANFIRGYASAARPKSPMQELAPVVVNAEPTPMDVPVKRTTQTPGLANVRITAMMGTGDKSCAVVNGRVVRVGDKIAGGYVVAAINIAGGSVGFLPAGATVAASGGEQNQEDLLVVRWDRSSPNTKIEPSKRDTDQDR